MKIVLLNVATLPVYRYELANLLVDAVTEGASVGYETPFSHEEAERYVHGLRPSVAEGERLLWIARNADGVVGSIQLELCQKSNGQNRAEIQKLLVHSHARRQGIGKQLLSTLEKAALQYRRGLLYLDTQAGSPAESFYRSQRYRYLGELPDYASSPNGYYHPTAIYYKRLFAVNRMERSLAS
ncbi:GNAT family N-acetyltransferase [Pectobacteriaceae bacterium CE70]|uniref:N-acetyltransferase n=1 Tax=Serratia sp. (strain ATCC 39006) TaxID=104623 RepID=A0A2I5TEW7_SERS3|nr:MULTISPECIES: GNAT family N-acetyltransferase [Enterobacterales]WJV62824.1 GNAT family N-acetyltransferase [Pectobacteriaceae bacterium C52]WJV67160.1 GNAT family N-acetyltransferase [Pectobacteriaceae bacterium CE70]WJY11143.1 GNAT family N-acetyltransferase [Pectobacteriaceae bacterium C80]AUG98772.1 N-acetyltransferase [Serratia sp. ATCC 39006]AUH03087.1 N-acetyltransferase [Serratia sp. ATCC 39006]